MVDQSSRGPVPLVAYVAIGSALGAVARHLSSVATLHWLGSGFPLGTLGVNVVGSFAIGLYAAAALSTRDGRSRTTSLLVVTGFLGGFTTFSAFSLETLELVRSGRPSWALSYLAISLALWVPAAWAGFRLGRRSSATSDDYCVQDK